MQEEKKEEQLRPCCVCKESRKKRDDCYLFAPSNLKEDKDIETHCKLFIMQHSKCLKEYGFNFD